MDYDRGLAELIEFDNAIQAVVDWADAREENDTLIIVTADHGQGFDAYGTVDTQFFNEDLGELQQRLFDNYGIDTSTGEVGLILLTEIL
jgi:alkaline phosphatase